MHCKAACTKIAYYRVFGVLYYTHIVYCVLRTIVTVEAKLNIFSRIVIMQAI